MTLLGSAPHHERVLAVVLVVANPYRKGDVPYHVLKPNSPEWESFWQDIGRPDEGPKGTPEAPATDECVQRACPTDYCAASNCAKLGCPGCDYVKPEPASRPCDCGLELVRVGCICAKSTKRPEPDPVNEAPKAARRPGLAPEPAYGLRFTPEEERRHREYEREQIARQLVPEPACPTHARPLLYHPRREVYECPECVFAIPADERGAIREDHVPFARALTPDQPITYTATKTHAIPLREPVAKRYTYKWRDWTPQAQSVADRCNAFWSDRQVAAREPVSPDPEIEAPIRFVPGLKAYGRRRHVPTLGDLEKAEAALADVLKRATPWLRRQHKPYSEEGAA